MRARELTGDHVGQVVEIRRPEWSKWLRATLGNVFHHKNKTTLGVVWEDGTGDTVVLDWPDLEVRLPGGPGTEAACPRCKAEPGDPCVPTIGEAPFITARIHVSRLIEGTGAAE